MSDTTRLNSRGAIEIVNHNDLDTNTWSTFNYSDTQFLPQTFHARLQTDFKAEVYRFKVPIQDGNKSYTLLSFFFTSPWVMEFIYNGYKSAKVATTVQSRRATLEKRSLSGIHIRDSRHSELTTSIKKDQPVTAKTKISGEYEYSISIPGSVTDGVAFSTNFFERCHPQTFISFDDVAGHMCSFYRYLQCHTPTHHHHPYLPPD